jgi:hypothetical protein
MTKGVRWWAPLAVSLLALFVALGGVSWAEAVISGKQIKKNSIPLNRLTKAAQRALAGVQGPIGPPGQQGPPGKQGPAGPFIDVVPSGKTLFGTYAVRYIATGVDSYFGAISFDFKFLAALSPHFVALGTTPPIECPGNGLNPQAAPGNLCIYETSETNRTLPGVLDVNFNPGTTSPFGAIIATSSTAPGQGGTTGSWAATAP